MHRGDAVRHASEGVYQAQGLLGRKRFRCSKDDLKLLRRLFNIRRPDAQLRGADGMYYVIAYRVLWYDGSATWEPAENVSTDLIRAFELALAKEASGASAGGGGMAGSDGHFGHRRTHGTGA